MKTRNSGTREKLLDAAYELNLRKGFVATTVDQICARAGVTKGSFFHYFESKDALGMAEIDRFCGMNRDFIAVSPRLTAREPMQRISQYIDMITNVCRDPIANCCLVGVLSQEISGSHPEMREGCRQTFSRWTAGLKAELDAAKAKYKPRATGIDTQSLAEHFIAVFEGALILAKAKNDIAPVASSLEHFKSYLRSVFQTP
jgi:TetR/AcrR family transcriptional repressor of nem operon